MKAPTASAVHALEREIVILIFERSGKIFEVFAGPAACTGRRTLRAPSGRCGAASAAACAAVRVVITRPAPPAEHDQLAHVDLRAVARLTLLVLPLAVLDASFDVQLVALLHVLLDDVGELRALGVPDHAAVPLRLLLLVTGLVVPGATRRERKGRDAVPTRGRPHLGIVPEVADQRHLVQAPAHMSSWRERKLLAAHSIDVAGVACKRTSARMTL